MQSRPQRGRLQIEVVTTETLDGVARGVAPFDSMNCGFNHSGDAESDLILQGEDIVQGAFKLLGPHLRALAGVGEVDRDADP